MLNVRGDKYKLLYDLEVSKVDAVKISKLEEGEKPSIMSDTMFHTMFYNENRLKYSVKFISYYLDISYEKLLKNITLSKDELDKDKYSSKGYRSDYIALIDNAKINIEVNNNSNEKYLKRNMDYAFRLYGSGVKRGKGKSTYKYKQIIQFNLNNFSFVGNNNVVEVYTLNSKNGIRLTNDIIFIQIYIPNLRKKWYNLGIQRLTEDERYILGLVEPNIVSSLELGKDIKIMDEYIKEVDEVVDDEYFGASYDKELALKEESYSDGVKEERNAIAKAMLKDGMDIDIIEKYTGISKNEIKSLSVD